MRAIAALTGAAVAILGCSGAVQLEDLDEPWVSVSLEPDGETASVSIGGLDGPSLTGSCPTLSNVRGSLGGQPLALVSPAEEVTGRAPHGVLSSTSCRGPRLTAPVDPAKGPFELVIEDDSARWALHTDHVAFATKVRVEAATTEEIRLRYVVRPGEVPLPPSAATLSESGAEAAAGDPACASLTVGAPVVEGDALVLRPQGPVTCVRPLELRLEWATDTSALPAARMHDCPPGARCFVSPSSAETSTTVKVGVLRQPGEDAPRKPKGGRRIH